MNSLLKELMQRAHFGDAMKSVYDEFCRRKTPSKLYNCGGLPVDLIVPEEDVWEDQQWCLNIITETGSPDIARAEIQFFRAAQEFVAQNG